METVRLGSLPQDMQVLIDDFVRLTRDEHFGWRDNGKAPPESLSLIEVMVEDLPEVPLDEFDRGASYAAEMDLDRVSPIIVADGRMLDGKHRVYRARQTGRGMLKAIDLTGIADPAMVEANSLGVIGSAQDLSP